MYDYDGTQLVDDINISSYNTNFSNPWGIFTGINKFNIQEDNINFPPIAEFSLDSIHNSEKKMWDMANESSIKACAINPR